MRIAALVAALQRFLAEGTIGADEHALLLCTGTGMKYSECWGM